MKENGMKIWQALLAIGLLGCLAVLLVYAAVTLPLWTFVLLLVVVAICLLSRELDGNN